MFKRILLFLSVIIFLPAAIASAQPKYVFLFIGDGMGANQIQLTETYQAALQGRIGTEPLNFASFPVATVASHYSADSDLTDSAASGTALATGRKTANGHLGVSPDNSEKYVNMAEMAKRDGRKVAVLSTCAANHATPAAFAAHQSDRNMYYEISLDMIENGFDFYGGSGLYNENFLYDRTPAEPIRTRFAQAGYTICSTSDYENVKAGADRILMLPAEGEAISYRMDADSPDFSKTPVLLKDMVSDAIDFLMKDGGKEGFFMMAEGGRIDHACHSNDAATAIREIQDFDEAISLAYEFYKKHPKQTLIVVTADHDTGGMVFKAGKPEQLSILRFQKNSENMITDLFNEKISKSGDSFSWEDAKAFLGEQLGLWKEVPMSWSDEKALRDIYESSTARHKEASVKDLYNTNSMLVSKAVDILNYKAGVRWGADSHTSVYVPVFAVGAGSDSFTHRTDNAEIGRTIIKVAKYK